MTKFQGQLTQGERAMKIKQIQATTKLNCQSKLPKNLRSTTVFSMLGLLSSSTWASSSGQEVAGAMLWFSLGIIGLFVGCILISSLMPEPRNKGSRRTAGSSTSYDSHSHHHYGDSSCDSSGGGSSCD